MLERLNEPVAFFSPDYEHYPDQAAALRAFTIAGHHRHFSGGMLVGPHGLQLIDAGEAWAC